jgi:hypothetical protein
MLHQYDIMGACWSKEPEMSHDTALCQEYPLELALEDFGIATLGSCLESEPGFLQLEFPSIDDMEELLTLLLVAMGNKPIKEPDAYDFLYSRMLGSGVDARASWKFDAHPVDCRDLLDPGEVEKKPVIPYAVAFKVSLKFPKGDYSKIMELLIGHYR